MDKRFNEDGSESYSIEQIWDHHAEIARLLTLGLRPKRIAADIGVTEQTVSNVRNTPQVKARLAELQSLRDKTVVEIRDQIKERVPKALEVMDEVMDDLAAKDSDKLRAALGILDHAIPKQSNHSVIGALITSDDIDEINSRAKKIEDVEYSEIE